MIAALEYQLNSCEGKMTEEQGTLGAERPEDLNAAQIGNPYKQRKPRSDKGIPKPKPEIPAGNLRVTINAPADEIVDLLVYFAKKNPEVGHQILDALARAARGQ